MAAVSSLVTQLGNIFADCLVLENFPPHTDPVVRRSDHADFQVNAALALAKKAGVVPRELATKLISHVRDPLIESCDVSGPGFINITISDKALLGQLADRVEDARLGVPECETKQTIVIDYCQPNVAKELHVGHLRSAVIGDALCNMLSFYGHNIIPRHHIGDWGTAFGMLIEYLISNDLDLNNDAGEFAHLSAMSKLNLLYKNSRELFDSDPNFADQARKRVVKLQAGDKQTLELWSSIVETSIEYFYEVFEVLGLPIDPRNIVGESAYNDMLLETTNLLRERGVAVVSQGAICVFFPNITSKDGSQIPLIIQKSDGGFGYAASDLSAIRNRVDVLGANKILYVVDARQSLHFNMVFDTARRADFAPDSCELTHVPFGTILGKDGKPFKTRDGETVRLYDLLNAAIGRARTIIEEKSLPTRDPVELEAQAKAVGIGSIKYADLSTSLGKDYIFDIDSMVNFQGNTAAYIQYAYARIQSIADKNSSITPRIHLDVPLEEAERKLLITLDEINAVCTQVSSAYEPHILAHYLYTIASDFTTFYDQCSIRHANSAAQQENRLLIAITAGKFLRWGLEILGIATPHQL